jgi:hypothetical protein
VRYVRLLEEEEEWQNKEEEKLRHIVEQEKTNKRQAMQVY